MRNYSIATIERIVQRFESRSLPKPEWNHEAHIIKAIRYNTNHHFPTALTLVRNNIRSYNDAVGTPNTLYAGYHETLTVFWMILTKNFLLSNPKLTLEASVNGFLTTANARRDIVFSHYSKQVLFSKEARRKWVNDDLKEINLNYYMMDNHFDLTDATFLSQLEEGTLPVKLFNHEAHLRLAWIHIKAHGLDKAIEMISAQLLNYVDKVGARDKYNTTLTVAAAKIVHHFMEKSETDSFLALLEAYPRLRDNFKDLIATHYGFDIYHSERAQKEYLAPDLLPF
ncbi:MAG: hypothetical protein ACFB0B_18390 [Thermonemataceae bacterium]